jgi:RNA polymerase sigma-70 factor (ECF subfamily)
MVGRHSAAFPMPKWGIASGGDMAYTQHPRKTFAPILNFFRTFFDQNVCYRATVPFGMVRIMTMLAIKHDRAEDRPTGSIARNSGLTGRNNGVTMKVAVTTPKDAMEPLLDDDTLLARIANGDRGAFAVLASRHTARALAVAQRILGGAGEADEVVQEAWVRVWTRAGQWQAGGNARFSTWLHRVVVNLCIDRRRRPGFSPLEDAPEMADPSPSAGALIARREMSEQMAAALADLPERQRAAIALCYYEEMSAAEAGKVMELSIPAVESLLARARRALRSRLAAMGVTGVGEDE